MVQIHVSHFYKAFSRRLVCLGTFVLGPSGLFSLVGAFRPVSVPCQSGESGPSSAKLILRDQQPLATDYGSAPEAIRHLD